MTRSAVATDRSGPRPLRVGAALAGVVLAAVALFSLGVMTGSRVARRAPEPAASAPAPPAAPVAPPPPAAVPAGTLTFYDRLSGAAPPLPPVPADDPAARPAAAATPAPLPSPAATAPDRPADPPRDAPAPAPAAAWAPAKPPADARPAPAAGTAEQVRRLMAKGPFFVQVAAVADRAAAAATAERLGRQGLPAATVSAVVNGKTWYRVRVGSFPSREAADRAAGLLRAGMGLAATPVRG